jgi:esterase/lipase superfamily enzyme
MLAAPDVDVDLFGTEITAMHEPRPNFTLLISRDDHALAVSRHVWGSVARLGAIDARTEPYKSKLAAQHVTVVDLTKHDTNDRLNHGKFASSPEMVRLLGDRLDTGQAIDDWHEGIGDRIVAATTGAAASVGTATGLAVAAPISVVDPVTREHLSDDVDELNAELQDTTSSMTDGQSAR